MADTENINIRIRLRDAAKFAGETRKAKREIDQLGNAAERADRKARKASAGYSLMQRTLKLVKTGALIAGFVAIAQTGAAAGGVTIALVAALAPLIGLLGALPALAVLGGQGLGVAKLGLMGVTDAVGGLNAELDPKKFALLSRPAQDFALRLDALKPRIRSLQRSVQRGMFPGLVEGLDAATPAIAQLQGPLALTGREVGRFGSGLGKLVGSRGFLADLRSQAYFNAAQIEVLGGGTLHLVSAFRTLMVTSRPLVAWLVRLAASGAATVDEMLLAGRASGGLQRGFHSIQVTTSRVFRLLWALGSALFHVGAVGRTAIGGGLLLALLHGAQALDQWTQSTEGVRKLTGAFEGSEHILRQVAQFASEIATGVGPSVIDLTKNMIAAFLPLISGGGGGAVAGLKLYIDALSLLARAVVTLEQNVPGATTVLSALLALMIVNSKLQVIGFARDGIGFLTRGMRLLVVATTAATVAETTQMGVFTAGKALMVAFTSTTVGMRIALAALAVQEGITTAATWALTRAQTALGIATGTTVATQSAAAASSKVGLFRSTGRLLGGALAAGLIYEAVKNAPSLGEKIGHVIMPLQPGAAPNRPKSYKPPAGAAPYQEDSGPLRVIKPGGSATVAPASPGTGSGDPHWSVFEARLTPPRLATVRRSSGGAGGAGRDPVHVHVHSTLKVDRKTLAKATNEAIADEKAGG